MAGIDSKELAEWNAYWKLEPFGEFRADVRAAQIAWVVAESHRDQKRGRAFTLWDFMPFIERPAMESDAMLAYAEMANVALGGLDLRPGRGGSSAASGVNLNVGEAGEVGEEGAESA